MKSPSDQREWSGEALRLNQEASQALQPLHDDLAELTPTFDGIVYFAVDKWHRNNASAVVTVQPDSNDIDRFLFYEQNIKKHRVDLGATALGIALQMDEPMLLRSRMNPDKHITWAHRLVVDDGIAGGLQAAFNSSYGQVPNRTDSIDKAWAKHSETVQDVAVAFRELSEKTDSVGDTLELLAPATPNAYILSWDLHHSTDIAANNYGTLRNYLIDTKSLFRHETDSHSTHIHDTGDGQDITLWLPDGVDRSSVSSVRTFGTRTVLPLLDQLKEKYQSFADTSYSEINPKIHFAIGLGYVEQDRHDARTSQEYWPIAKLHKDAPLGVTSFTENALRILGNFDNNKETP